MAPQADGRLPLRLPRPPARRKVPLCAGGARPALHQAAVLHQRCLLCRPGDQTDGRPIHEPAGGSRGCGGKRPPLPAHTGADAHPAALLRLPLAGGVGCFAAVYCLPGSGGEERDAQQGLRGTQGTELERGVLLQRLHLGPTARAASASTPRGTRALRPEQPLFVGYAGSDCGQEPAVLHGPHGFRRDPRVPGGGVAVRCAHRSSAAGPAAVGILGPAPAEGPSGVAVPWGPVQSPGYRCLIGPLRDRLRGQRGALAGGRGRVHLLRGSGAGSRIAPQVPEGHLAGARSRRVHRRVPLAPRELERHPALHNALLGPSRRFRSGLDLVAVVLVPALLINGKTFRVYRILH
eukprot:jgi/Botrbrau1/10395/Bobra.0133s0004.1